MSKIKKNGGLDQYGPERFGRLILLQSEKCGTEKPVVDRISRGVNRGGRAGLVSQNLEWGTLMQIVISDFVMFQNLKDQIGCITFTMRKM